MGKNKILGLALLAVLPLLISGCGIRKAPAEILAFHAFYTGYDSGDVGFYIDWKNDSDKKTVDFLILSISFPSKDEPPLRYRILEPEGIAPGKHNRTNIYEIQQEELPSTDTASLEVSVFQIGYTDGSVWENGDDAVYAADDFSTSKWLAPGSDYYFGKKSITKLEFSSENAAVYEISVCKAVDSKGTVWENSVENDRITVIFCGKKGYRFGNLAPNSSIQALVHRIAEESEKYRLDLEEPEIFVREQKYCMLRYAGVDIRAELSETNEVLPNKVGFVYYSKGLHRKSEANLQAYLDRMESLRLCVCAAALTDLPYEEVTQKVDEYNKNSESYIDFEDPAYETFDTGNRVLDKYGIQNPCGVFAAGKDLYDPMESFFWVRENPYGSQDGG